MFVSNHVFDLEFFKGNQVIVFDQRVAEFMGIIQPLILDMIIMTLQPPFGFATIFAILLFACQCPIQNSQAFLGLLIELGMVYLVAIRCREQGGDTQIKANCLSGFG